MKKRTRATHRLKLGRAIRGRRENLHLSQEKLAELADVHRNYIGLIERGEQNVSIDSLVRIAKGLKSSLAQLMVDAGL